MNNISFEFKNGMMQNFKADTNGNCFREIMQPYTGPKEMFGNVRFRLNPALRVVEEGNANYRPPSAAGMVFIGIGDNRIAGGNNNTLGGYGFAVTNATVTIDGKTVIKDGKLSRKLKMKGSKTIVVVILLTLVILFTLLMEIFVSARASSNSAKVNAETTAPQQCCREKNINNEEKDKLENLLNNTNSQNRVCEWVSVRQRDGRFIWQYRCVFEPLKNKSGEKK